MTRDAYHRAVVKILVRHKTEGDLGQERLQNKETKAEQEERTEEPIDNISYLLLNEVAACYRSPFPGFFTVTHSNAPSWKLCR